MVSGNHWSGVSGISQVNKDSDMAQSVPDCCVGGGLKKDKWSLLSLLSVSSHPDARQYSSSLYIPDSFIAAVHLLGLRASVYEPSYHCMLIFPILVCSRSKMLITNPLGLISVFNSRFGRIWEKKTQTIYSEVGRNYKRTSYKLNLSNR